MDLYPAPAFRQDAEGWHAVDPSITRGSGAYPYEALGLSNPVHFGATATALVTIDTVGGPIALGLDGASVGAPRLLDGVVRYDDVFDGVDLELSTAGGRLGKHFILEDADSGQAFRFTINDPEHLLGEPAEGAGESWQFDNLTGFGVGLTLPAPAAWSSADGSTSGLPGTAHQQVSVTATGYTIDLSVDELWAETAEFPVVLDPAVEWTDEEWTNSSGLQVAFAPSGSATCNGAPCRLVDPVDGKVIIGDVARDDPDLGEYLTYVGVDLAPLASRRIGSATLVGYDYPVREPKAWSLCSLISPGDTGADLASARCQSLPASSGWGSGTEFWRVPVTALAQAAAASHGPTGSVLGLALTNERNEWDERHEIRPPSLRLSYTGYPIPQSLRREQTFGDSCWAGCAPSNQAVAADPVNTATGGLTESFADLALPGVGVTIGIGRHYNSLDASTGPLGQGWAFTYDASLTTAEGGELVFTDDSGGQTRFGALVGGGYAPLDPAVSATVTDRLDGAHVMRRLGGESMTFDASGRLTRWVDAQDRGVSLAYSGSHVATVTDAVGQVATLGWTEVAPGDERVTSVTLSDGRSVAYGYDSMAGAVRLTSSTAVDGAVTRYAYDSATGGLSAITDPMGNVSARNTYDPEAGRITSQRDETGAETTFAWDEASQTATITDPTGRTRRDVYVGLNLVKQVDGAGAVTETLYDADNNPSAAVDADGDLFREDYDDRDRLIRRVSPPPINATEAWAYDDQDRVTSHTDPAGNTTSYVYNEAGLLASQTNPDGGVLVHSYTDGSDGSPANLLATSTDPLGRTTSYRYNAVGDTVAVTTPTGRTTSYVYDASHWLTSVTSPAGAVSTYTYDSAGRVLTTTDPVGSVTTNRYDAAGRLAETTAADGTWLRYTYDAAGRSLGSLTSAGATSSTTYDAAGRVATTTNALGGVTAYAYDDAGRVLTTTDPLGNVTTNTYDASGQLASTTDAAGGVTSYARDVLGRVTQVTDPDGVVTSTTYDLLGNVATRRNAAGASVRLYYDAMGRPTGQYDDDGVYSERAYDLAGQLSQVSSSAGVTTFGYDVDGNRTTVVDPRGNAPGGQPSAYATTTAYDADGRPTVVTDPLGDATRTTYDAAGRVVAVADATGATTARAYDVVGRVTQVTGPTGATTAYGYDASGNLDTSTAPGGAVTHYTYDVGGNPVSKTDALGRVTERRYNSAGQLVSLTAPSGTATADEGDGVVRYAYDAAGRVTGVEYAGATPDLTFTYTLAGRPDVMTRADDGTGVAGIDYTYDELGRVSQVSRTGPTSSVVDYGYTLMGRVADVAWSNGVRAAYTYDSQGQVATVSPGGVAYLPTLTYAYDPAGNLTGLRRAVGSIDTTSSYAYDAAGRMTSLAHTLGSTVVASYALRRDAVGNPTAVTSTLAGPGGAGSATSTTTYSYNPAGWITSECEMSMTAVCAEGSPQRRYTYDGAGRRRTVTTVGSGGQATTTEYAYDAADESSR